MIKQSIEAYSVSVFMAGDIARAIEICRSYCDRAGLCVTVAPATYVYTGGQEAGFIVGLINYARLPSSKHVIDKHALELASELRIALNQKSFTIQCDLESNFYSWRD